MKAIRLRLQETQTQHCFHYKISRFTYLRWEKLGPPKHIIIRAFIRLMLRKLDKRARQRVGRHARWERQKAAKLAAKQIAKQIEGAQDHD